MANRVKEQGVVNSFTAKHDEIGNYLDMNGTRFYTLDTALNDGDSTTVGGSTAPAGSIAKTTHPTGKESIFQASSSTWEKIGGSGEDVDAIKATGYYNFLTAPVANDSRTFNGVAFSWKASPSSAVQAQVVTAVTDFNNTVLGENLYNMVQKLNASSNGAINVATYSTNATGGHKNGDRIITEYDTAGIVGNAYTLDDANDALSHRSGATLLGGVDAKVGFKIYRANATQVSTSAPTASVALNELGGAAPVLTRTSAGIYPITKVGAFASAKKPFFKNGAIVDFGSPNKVVFYSFVRTSDDVVTLNVAEVTYTAANNVTIAAKEISAMTVPLIPIEIIVTN